MRREGVVALAGTLPGCVVAMEACCGAHHLGRRLVAQGHEVRLSTFALTSRRRRTTIVTSRPSPRPRPGRRCNSRRSRARRIHPARARDRGAARPPQPARRHGGAAVGRRARRWSWRWPPNSSRSPGRCCAIRPASLPTSTPRCNGNGTRRSPDVACREGLRVVEARGPDSQPVSRQPLAQNGT